MTRIPGVLFCGLVLAHCWTSPTSASPFDEPGFHIKLTERLGLRWTPRYPRSATGDDLSITRLAPGGMPLDLEFLDPAESILLFIFSGIGLLCRHILRRRKVAAWRASWIGLAVWLFFPAAGAGLTYWALATAAI